MELPVSKLREEYADEIKVIEANIKDIASGTAPQELYRYSQDKLDKLAERFQDKEQLGTARYKLYELQALLYYFQERDADALEFIQQAIETKGSSYKRAEQLIEQIQSAKTGNSTYEEHVTARKEHSRETDDRVRRKSAGHELPLELQSQIKTLRTYSIVMIVLSILSVYFIPWAVLYIILATKLKPENLPSRKLIKGTAIATLPLCLGLIPILVNIEFWKMNKRLKEYEEHGSKAFMSDKEFLEGEPKRKKSSRRAWIVLLSLVAIFVVLIIVAMVSSSSDSNSTNDSGSFLNSETTTPYTSSQHGFVVSFPGFPTTETSTIDVEGVAVPYTYYSKEIDSGSKAYAVQVVQYPTSDFNLTGQERGGLDGAINGTAQTDGYSLVTSSNSGTFRGYPSATATFKYSDGESYDVFSHYIIKGNNMYVVMTVGESKSTFDAFVNSFNFK